MKIIFCNNSAFKKSNSIVFFNEYCSINVMELPIKFGATKAKILAIIVIIIPTIILDLYLKKNLFKYFNSLMEMIFKYTLKLMVII